MLKEYGPVFLVFHTCTSILTIGIFYILVSRDIDVSALIELSERFVDLDKYLPRTGFTREHLLSPESSKTTSLALSLLLYKLTGPFRIVLDSVMVPVLVRKFRYLGVMEPESPLDPGKVALAISRIEEEIDARYSEPAVRAIRTRVRKRDERRVRQMRQYAVTQRKIDKVIKKRNATGKDDPSK